MDAQSAVRLFVYIVVVGVIFGVLFWLASYLGGVIGPPVGPYLQIVVVVLGALVLLGFLLHLVGVKAWNNNGGPPALP